jgi:hypothetical protein
MGGLFGGSAPPPPKPQPPAPMPDDQSPAVLEARRQKMLAAGLRQGRDSTILSNPSDRASSAPSASGDYSRSTLGGR